MKLRFLFGLAILAALLIGSGNMAFAFHSGGVAECGGCHSMHSSKPASDKFLLVGSDQSSTCLTCHEKPGDTGPSSYHISTAAADMPAGVPPKQRGPGGDFGWLKKTYSYVVRGESNTEEGRTHGHNIIALDNGYGVDPDKTTAPGGTFPSSQLGCQSCHDPHGQVRRLNDGTYVRGGVIGAATAPISAAGSSGTIPVAGLAVGTYRLLRGLNDATQGVTYTGVAIAVSPTYQMTEATNQLRVAYGASGINTWGNWCATCHPDMHSSTGKFVHKIDESLGATYANNYNAYVKSGDMTGTSATSFTSLVPFMENTGDIATLKSHASSSGGYKNGPGTTDKVSCLSCHRAHASGFPEMLRWDMESEFIVKNGAYGVTDRARTTDEALASYYDRPTTQFATYQRGLCNKCHAKD